MTPALKDVEVIFPLLLTSLADYYDGRLPPCVTAKPGACCHRRQPAGTDQPHYELISKNGTFINFM